MEATDMSTCRVVEDTDRYLREMEVQDHNYEFLTSQYPITPFTFRGFNAEDDYEHIEMALSDYPELFAIWAEFEDNSNDDKEQLFIDALPFEVIKHFLYEYEEMYDYQRVIDDFLI